MTDENKQIDDESSNDETGSQDQVVETAINITGDGVATGFHGGDDGSRGWRRPPGGKPGDPESWPGDPPMLPGDDGSRGW